MRESLKALGLGLLIAAVAVLGVTFFESWEAGRATLLFALAGLGFAFAAILFDWWTLGIQAGAQLRSGPLGPIPSELASPPPRQHNFTGGYLRQGPYRAKFLPLLRNGFVARGIVVRYRSVPDGEGPVTSFSYAWLDHNGRVRVHSKRESYDGMHAGMGTGSGAMVLDVDARLRLGLRITVVYDPDSDLHVIYEALHVGPDESPDSP